MVIIYERWSYLRISGTLWDPSGSSLEALWGLGWPLGDLGASEAKRAKTCVFLL